MKIPRWLGWTIGVSAFAVMFYACALPDTFPADNSSDGLVGTYTVNGVDPTDVEYSGTVTIVGTDASDTFEIEWIVTGGIHQGVGVRRGAELRVDWTAVASGGGTGGGTAVYVIHDDGRLVGTRLVSGFDVAGTEEIFPDR